MGGSGAADGLEERAQSSDDSLKAPRLDDVRELKLYKREAEGDWVAQHSEWLAIELLNFEWSACKGLLT